MNFTLCVHHGLLRGRRAALTFLHELVQQTAPLVAEGVGSGEAAVSAAHAQVGHAFLHQVEGGGDPPLAGREGLAAGAADHRPTLQQKDVRLYKTTASRRDSSELCNLQNERAWVDLSSSKLKQLINKQIV